MSGPIIHEPPGRSFTHTMAEWQAEGERRFGANMLRWKFACPNCGHVAAVADYAPFQHLGADANAATCTCIGLYTGVATNVRHPCRYSAWGPVRLCPVRILTDHRIIVPCFSFAED